MAKAQAARGPGAVEQLADWILTPRPQDIPRASSENQSASSRPARIV